MLLLLLACEPEAPLGSMDEDVMSSLWVGVSQDNLTWLYFTARNVWVPATEDEDCPQKTNDPNAAGYIVTGGCTDEWGNTWLGEMSVWTDEAYADLQDFGVSYEPVDMFEVSRTWTYDGDVSWTVDPDDAHVDFIVDGVVDFASEEGDTRTEVLAELNASATLNRSVDTMTVGTGELEMEDWGRVEFAIDDAKLDGSWGCDNGADGVIEITGTNQAAIWLPSVTECLENQAACPQLELGGERSEWCETSNKLGWNAPL